MGDGVLRRGPVPGNEVGDGVRSGRPAPPDIASATDEYASRFQGSVGRWFLEVQGRAVVDLLSRVAPRDVLEVGGGHAQLTPYLRTAGFEVIVHGSDTSCALRTRRLFSADEVPFLAGGLLDLPVADASVDAVVAIRLAAHADDLPAFLRECARVARRAVLIDFPSLRSVNLASGVLFAWKKRLEATTRRYRSMWPGEPARALRSAGFSCVATVPQYFLPMALHRLHGTRTLGTVLEAPFRMLGLTRCFGSPVLALYVRREAA